MKKLNCPQCGNPMDILTINREHCNSQSRHVRKGKYYQYHCDQCDDDGIGWTTTESDEQSIKDFA